MLDHLPTSVWFDPNKRWLEPAAGDGNFLVEIKARLLQAGHDEKHILDNMLFSVELIDDNHWALQHRLGYLVDGQPNPKFWPNGENFAIAKIHQLTQDLNDKNPYHEQLGLERDEVLHHRNHVCWTALEYDMSFSRSDSEDAEVLEVLPEHPLGEWPETDTPDIGEKYIVEKMLGRQPQLAVQESPKQPSPPKAAKVKSEKKPKAPPTPRKTAKGGGWQVKAEWIGKGLKIKCKAPYDGSFWECDHDLLVEKINASLKEKGKPLIGQPGPSEKSYGSSSGLREIDLWERIK